MKSKSLLLLSLSIIFVVFFNTTENAIIKKEINNYTKNVMQHSNTVKNEISKNESIEIKISQKNKEKSSMAIFDEIISGSTPEERFDLILELIDSFDENSESEEVMTIVSWLIEHKDTRRDIISYLPSFLSPTEMTTVYERSSEYFSDEEKKIYLSAHHSLSLINNIANSDSVMISNDLEKFKIRENLDSEKILALSFNLIDKNYEDDYRELHANSINKIGDFPLSGESKDIFFWLNAKSKLDGNYSSVLAYYKKLSVDQRIKLIKFNSNIIKMLPDGEFLSDEEKDVIESYN